MITKYNKFKQVNETLSQDRAREAKLQSLIELGRNMIDSYKKMEEYKTLKAEKNAEVQVLLEKLDTTSVIADGVLIEITKPFTQQRLSSSAYFKFIEEAVNTITDDFRAISDTIKSTAVKLSPGQSYIRKGANTTNKETGTMKQEGFGTFLKDIIKSFIVRLGFKLKKTNKDLFSIKKDFKKFDFNVVTEGITYTVVNASDYAKFRLEQLGKFIDNVWLPDNPKSSQEILKQLKKTKNIDIFKQNESINNLTQQEVFKYSNEIKEVKFSHTDPAFTDITLKHNFFKSDIIHAIFYNNVFCGLVYLVSNKNGDCWNAWQFDLDITPEDMSLIDIFLDECKQGMHDTVGTSSTADTYEEAVDELLININESMEFNEGDEIIEVCKECGITEIQHIQKNDECWSWCSECEIIECETEEITETEFERRQNDSNWMNEVLDKRFDRLQNINETLSDEDREARNKYSREYKQKKRDVANVLIKAKESIELAQQEVYYQELAKTQEKMVINLLKEFSAKSIVIDEKILSLVESQPKETFDMSQYEEKIQNAEEVGAAVALMAKALMDVHKNTVEVSGSVRQYADDTQSPDGTFGARFDYNDKVVKLPESVNTDNKFEYMLLSRLQSDCDYFLGNGAGSERTLHQGSVEAQITKMKELWNNLTEKPEWLSMEEIENYETKMLQIKSESTNEGIGSWLNIWKNVKSFFANFKNASKRADVALKNI